MISVRDTFSNKIVPGTEPPVGNKPNVLPNFQGFPEIMCGEWNTDAKKQMILQL